MTPECQSRERGQSGYHYLTPNGIHQSNYPVTTHGNEKEGSNDVGTRPPHSRTSSKRQNPSTSPETPKVGRDQSLDHQLHCWISNIPPQYDPYPSPYISSLPILHPRSHPSL